MPTARSVVLLVAMILTIVFAFASYPSGAPIRRVATRDKAGGGDAAAPGRSPPAQPIATERAPQQKETPAASVLTAAPHDGGGVEGSMPSHDDHQRPLEGTTATTSGSGGTVDRDVVPTAPPSFVALPNGSFLLDGVYVLDRDRCSRRPEGKGRHGGEGGNSRVQPPTTYTTATAPHDDSAPWSNFVFGVLTEPRYYEARLSPMLDTWLHDAFHVFLYVAEPDVGGSGAFEEFHQQLNRQSRNGSGNITVVPIAPLAAPGKERNGTGAWKNLPALLHLAAQVDNLSHKKKDKTDDATQEPPKWYVIIDDDTYLLQRAVLGITDDILLGLKPTAAGSSTAVYAGHPVEYCKLCRTAKKRFNFAFGGNGIFLNQAGLRKLADGIARCHPKLPAIAGDERVGFCAKTVGLALTPMYGGTETMFSALGDNRAAMDEGPFPFSFHRLKERSWIEDLRTLELRHLLDGRRRPHTNTSAAVLPPWLCWHHVAAWYLARGNTSTTTTTTTASAVAGSGEDDDQWIFQGHEEEERRRRPAYPVDLYYPHSFDPFFKAHKAYHERLRADFSRRGSKGGKRRGG